MFTLMQMIIVIETHSILYSTLVETFSSSALKEGLREVVAKPLLSMDLLFIDSHI